MSASMRPTRRPWRASAAARFTETLDLPTPPLPEETASTLPRCGNSTGVGGGGTAAPGASPGRRRSPAAYRSEEHTSELQSRENLVCRLLLEKKYNFYDDLLAKYDQKISRLHSRPLD